MVRDPAHRLGIVKTLRLSEALLQKIKAECTACKKVPPCRNPLER